MVFVFGFKGTLFIPTYMPTVLVFYCCEKTRLPWQLLLKKAFNWDCLIVQRFRLLSAQQEVWQHSGRCDAREISESSPSGSTGRRKREKLGLGWTSENSKPIPVDTLLPSRPLLLTLSNTATPW